MVIRLNLSPGPVDFRRFISIESEGLMMPHWSIAFAELHETVAKNLRLLLEIPDQGEIAFTATSGTGTLEILLLNVLKQDERILVLANGFFGERLSRMTNALGFKPYTLGMVWDSPIDVSQVLDMISSKEFQGTKAVVVVHLETSTGILNDIATIGQALKDSEALYLVDAVSSVGPHLIEMNKWGIDGLVTVAYKGLLSPPGLSIIALSKKYYEVLSKHSIQSYYFDLKKIIELSRKHTTVSTVPVNAMIVLDRVLKYMVQQH